MTREQGSVVAIVQARMGATRLPGKVMKEVGGSPLLETLFQRISTSELADEIVVATSASGKDDRIAEFAKGRGIPLYRGPENDVLKRLIEAADEYGASTVVRICADNPLTEGQMIDELVGQYHEAGAEYCRSVNHPTPVEVVGEAVLRSIDGRLLSREERGHVTLHIQNNPDAFDVKSVDFGIQTSARLTVDYPEDLHMYRKLADRLGSLGDRPISEVLEYLESDDHVRGINESADDLPVGWENRPEITVITRTRNSEDVVPRAIQSAVNQTLDRERYEILVIDDGSTDDTVEVVSDYVEEFPELIRLVETPHEGAIRTLNEGIDVALGKYVTLLDADDTFEPLLLERLYEVLETDLSISYSYCNYYERTTDGNCFRVDVSEDVFKTIAAGIMFRKEAHLELGGYDEELIFPEYDLLIQCHREGLVGEHVAEPLLTYYRHGESLTADAERVRKGAEQLREKYGDSFSFREY